MMKFKKLLCFYYLVFRLEVTAILLEDSFFISAIYTVKSLSKFVVFVLFDFARNLFFTQQQTKTARRLQKTDLETEKYMPKKIINLS